MRYREGVSSTADARSRGRDSARADTPRARGDGARSATAARARLSRADREFLDDLHFGVLATVGRDGSPHLSVVWYELRDDAIVMNTAVGRQKDRNILRDPRAAFMVEDGYRWVRVRGRVERVTERAAALEDIRRLAVRYMGKRDGEEAARSFAAQERVSYRLRIESVSRWSSE